VWLSNRPSLSPRAEHAAVCALSAPNHDVACLGTCLIISGVKMRSLLALSLAEGRLYRRYLNYPRCMTGWRLAWQQPYLSTQLARLGGGNSREVPHALAYRGLTLTWVGKQLGLTLLDTPHRKVYRLAFDTRLHTLKCYRRLCVHVRRSFSQSVAIETRSSPTSLTGYIGRSYTLELGAWGERTQHGIQFW
jgi:hypothetical protein